MPAPAPAKTSKRLLGLREKKSKLVAQMSAFLDKHPDGFQEDSDPGKEYGALEADLATIEASIKREERLPSEPSFSPAPNANSAPEGGEGDVQISVTPAWIDDPNLGYKSPKEFLMEVMQAPLEGRTSEKLNYLAAAGSDEQNTQADPYGGFFVPEGMSPNVLSIGAGADPTNPTPIPMTSPVVKINARVDKNHTTSVSGGLTVGRRAETQEAAASRQKYEQIKLEATGLFGVSFVTEELLERSPISFLAMIEAGFKDEFAAARIKEKISGTGAGEPLGILNSPCKIAVAKESGQSADTINATNVLKMRQRAYDYDRSIWLANPDTLLQLAAIHIAGTTSDNYLFAPGNGTNFPSILLGRPIFFTSWAKTLGDEGDLILGDWTQYLWGTLGPADPRRAESMHVRFLNHERTFKFWVENDGQPWWSAAHTPPNGVNTLSPFVTLAERA